MGSLSARIFKSIFFTVLGVVLVLNLAVGWLAYLLLDRQLQEDLQNTITLIAQVAESGGETELLEYLEHLSLQGTRTTLIADDGTVLYDSVVAGGARAQGGGLETMDNHLDRPEVVEALAEGSGFSKRHSDTLNEETTYLARVLDDGTILRVSGSQRSVVGHLASMIVPDLLILALAALVTLFVARLTSRRILRPFGGIDFAKPLESETYPELAPLLTKLNASFNELSDQQRALRTQQHEFDIVTGSMKEGLILVDATGHILSLNGAASRILNITEEVLMKTLSQRRHLLTVNRSSELQQLLEAVLGGSYTEAELEQEDRFYQLLGSPVFAEETDMGDGEAQGAVLLIRDVTEWHAGDVMRKQFSANVSHELKTPLTVINGYAELMKQGMVNPGDEARLAGLIHEESTRMIAMIDDILTLSQLDESGPARDVIEESFEDLDLCVITEEVCEQLLSFARERQITLVGPQLGRSSEGAIQNEAEETAVSAQRNAGDNVPYTIRGVRTLVTRMIYNLIENGIRYSDAGGSVTVNLLDEDGHISVEVSDTGIGIPLSLQDKVFERFFCVDQSRSKATGGTGLGLAIVKNAAKLHKADIELKSAEGQGTDVTIRFP